MATLTVVGATGLRGGAFLSLAKATPTISGISSITALTRRPVKEETSILPFNNIVVPDITTDVPKSTKVLFSGLGWYLMSARTHAKQKTVDQDLNIAVAKAAKSAGASTMVLISAFNADPESKY
ncbi:hypothetical protein V1512DRAFT_265895 [Lipomyces arxii]|uniref:uncharacterized protein n=1 Tax=Lipomyces arxii TaxID=56418 RepID=UPI0034CE8470